MLLVQFENRPEAAAAEIMYCLRGAICELYPANGDEGKGAVQRDYMSRVCHTIRDIIRVKRGRKQNN